MNNSTLILPARIGAELGGGIYAGPMVEDGQLVHLIAAKESLGSHDWETAKVEASRYKGGGFLDWRLPTKDELMVALVHAKSLFDQEWHWTSSLHSSYPWAVDFEDGYVLNYARRREFRVRPFRRHQFTPSPLSLPEDAPAVYGQLKSGIEEAAHALYQCRFLFSQMQDIEPDDERSSKTIHAYSNIGITIAGRAENIAFDALQAVICKQGASNE